MIRYTNTIEKPTGSSDVASLPLEAEKLSAELYHPRERILMLERVSDVVGKVEIYSPHSEPTEWKDHAWLIKLEKGVSGKDGEESYLIRADKIMDAFQSPIFVKSHKYLNE